MEARSATLEGKVESLLLGSSGFKVKSDLDTGARLTFLGMEQFEAYKSHARKGTVELRKLKYPIKVRVANKRYEYCRNYFVDPK